MSCFFKVKKINYKNNLRDKRKLFMSEPFYYNKQEKVSVETLEGEEVSVESLIDSKSPAYVYSLLDIQSRVRGLVNVVGASSIHYAIKANNEDRVLKLLQTEGVGLDVVSAGELKLGLEAGFKPHQIIYSGVAKSHEDIEYAIQAGIYQINAESWPEIQRIMRISEKLKTKVDIGIRVNPNISVETHPYITTGLYNNKFGINLDGFTSDLQKHLPKDHPYVTLRGLAVHLGSQIFDSKPLLEGADSLFKLGKTIQGLGYKLDRFDLGGGWGVNYEKGYQEQEQQAYFDYLEHVKKALVDKFGLNVHLSIEPGRFLVARAGILVCKVEYIKETVHKNFLIVNTGMHHLMRPCLYQAYHRIEPLKACDSSGEEKHKALKTYDVVGPICESTDVLGKDRVFGMVSEGDLLVIKDVGAYGSVLKNAYNCHEEPQTVFI